MLLPDIMTKYLSGIMIESTRKTREKHLRLFYKWILYKDVRLIETKSFHIKEYKQYLSLNKRCMPRTVHSYL